VGEEGLSDAQVNLLIFEQMMGAQRRRLPGDRCGLAYGTKIYDCFAGHDRFDEQAAWAAHYAGPDFVRDLNWAHVAERVANATGLRGVYLERLLPRVYPNWRNAEHGEDVLEFWFCLVHAGAAHRARALAAAARWSVQEDPPASSRHEDDTDDVDFRALQAEAANLIELARRVPAHPGVVSLDPANYDDHAEAAIRAGVALVERFVMGLSRAAAERLLAAYLFGTCDDCTFAGRLDEARRQHPAQKDIADKLTGIGPRVLEERLDDGLRKLARERSL
jgi:hypothetical protein